MKRDLLETIRQRYKLSMEDMAEILGLNSRQAYDEFKKANKNLTVKQVMELKRVICKIRKEELEFDNFLKEFLTCD